MTGQSIGTVTRYHHNLNIASVRLSDILRVGDLVNIQDSEEELSLPVEHIESLGLDPYEVRLAEPGQEIGIRVPRPVREGSRVTMQQEAPWP